MECVSRDVANQLIDFITNHADDYDEFVLLVAYSDYEERWEIPNPGYVSCTTERILVEIDHRTGAVYVEGV
jgi:hypothetical protein